MHSNPDAPRWAERISTRRHEASAKVTFRLGDGRMLDLAPGDQQLRRIDQAWASTVHAFQRGTVDTVIAAMEAKHPNLTNLEDPLCGDQPCARPGRAVTDDKPGLREQLEAVTGERITALEAVKPERAKGRVAGLDADRSTGLDGAAWVPRQPERTSGPDMEKARAPKGSIATLGCEGFCGG